MMTSSTYLQLTDGLCGNEDKNEFSTDFMKMYAYSGAIFLPIAIFGLSIVLIIDKPYKYMVNAIERNMSKDEVY